MKNILRLFVWVCVCSALCLCGGCAKEDHSHCMYDFYSGAADLDYALGNAIPSMPVFNPLNSNQIGYIRIRESREWSYEDTAIFNIYDLSGISLSQFFISEGWSVARPQLSFSWGSNDQILLKFHGFETWYSDGTGRDSLFDFISNKPLWSPDCSKILSAFEWPDEIHYASQLERLFVHDVNGVLLDSVSLPRITAYAWSGSGQIAVATNHKFINIYSGFSNLVKKMRVISDDLSYNRILSLQWIPNSQKVVWTTIRGIYITDVSTEQTQQLVAAPENLVYNSLSVSSDGYKIISGVVHFNCEFWSNTKLTCAVVDVSTGAVTDLPLFQ